MSAHPIPNAALAQHTIVLGKTRSGKSSAMRLMVESALDDQRPVCIIDPKGDWWGLKSSASGKRAGYPVIIFGGEHADVPLNKHAGLHVAELVATGNRPCIIDLGGWSVGDRTRFFIDFAGTLFRLSRGPRLLVIDEVHNFAPQGKIRDPDAGKMLHWANRLASEGSGKGITLLSASQRPQKVHKDFVTSNETLIAMRVIHPLDRDAIKDWIDGCPDPAKGKEVLGSLASMVRGEAWAWSPEIGFGPQRIKFPKFSTYDSFAAPSDEAGTKLTGWAAVDLEEVKTKLAAVVEEARANDPRALKAEIADLRKQLAKAPAAQAAPDPQTLAAAEVRADQRGYERGYAEGQRLVAHHATEVLDELGRAVQEKAAAFRAGAPAPSPAPVRASTPPPIAVPRPAPQKANGSRTPTPRPIVAAQKGGSAPIGPERRPLAVLAAFHPGGMTETQWRVGAGMKDSGTWSTYKSRLRTAGFIEERGGLWFITDAGSSAIGANFEPMPAPGQELIEFWGKRVGAAARMLRVIADAYPRAIMREEVAERLDMTESGTFSTYLSRLRSPGLIEVLSDRSVRLSPSLMGFDA